VLSLMLALMLLTVAAAIVLLPKRTGVDGWSDRAEARANVVTTDARVRELFRSPTPAPGPAAYEALAAYFLEGWNAYRTPGSERAHYPGAPSKGGRLADGLEGFSRMFPLASAWLASGRPGILKTSTGSMDIAQAFAEGLANGTDPGSPHYWGAVRDYSPQLVESADIALGLWLSRDFVWKRLDPGVRAGVVQWLIGSLESEPFDGNWQLFPLLVHRSLKALGVDVGRWDARMDTSWEYFKSFQRGDGWFFDPPNGFDYYNAWSIHYALFWLRQMDPDLDPGFIAKAQAEFAAFYKHLFGPQGHPEMGRSVCYRMAAPVPLLTAQALAPHAVSRGEAMRALDLTWSVFIGRGAIADGTVTQGFCGADLSTLALYSGPASCLWSLRSLVVAFALDGPLNLFASGREALPVERGDFRVSAEAPGWTVVGTHETGKIELFVHGNPSDGGGSLVHYGWPHRAKEWLLKAPRRPDNKAALYGRPSYASDRPVSDCRAADS